MSVVYCTYPSSLYLAIQTCILIPQLRFSMYKVQSVNVRILMKDKYCTIYDAW